MGLKDELRKEYNADAQAYEPGLPAATLAHYAADLREVVGQGDGRLALDVGAGAGTLTKILQELGFCVRGVDFAPEMVAAAKRTLPGVDFKLVDDIERCPDAYPAETFDLIACRHVANHLADPIRTFRQWSTWLKPSGRVAVIDALWTRDDWPAKWAKFPDNLPLACTQTWATVAYMLQQAGFSVTERQWLQCVNEHEAARTDSTRGSPIRRYVVVGRRS